MVASVIEISKNIFSSKKYGLSGKETRKKKKKPEKRKIRERGHPFRTVEYI